MLKYVLYLLVLLVPLRNIVEKVPNLFEISGLGPIHIIFITIVILMVFSSHTTQKEQQPQSRLDLPVALFLLYFFFLSFVTDSSILPLSERLVFWKDVFLAMSLYFIFSRNITSKKQIYIILAIMIFANFYMDLYFWRWIRWINFSHFRDTLKAINGTFGSVGGSNEWAAFFSTYTLIIIAAIHSNLKKRYKVILLTLAIINIIVMLFTFSRGAYLGFTAGIVWYSLQNKKMRYIFMLFILIIGYSFFLPKAVVERIAMSSAIETTTGEAQDQDVTSRLEMWSYAYSKILESPIWGHGLLSFRYKGWNNPHNQYLHIFYQGGFIGFVLFQWIFFSAYQENSTLHKNSASPFDRAMGAGMCAAIISIYVANFFGDRWSYFPLIGYFWILNAITLRLKTLCPDTTGDTAVFSS